MREREIGIIGGSGLVGSETVNYLGNRDIAVLCPSHSELDITNEVQVERFFLKHESVKSVILLAAYTDVEKAQIDPFALITTNVSGVANVARQARNYHKHFIYISTDFVFEGTPDNPGPYTESSRTAKPDSNKLGAYAQTKVQAEKIVKSVDPKMDRTTIVRISYPFGHNDSPKDFLNKTLAYIDNGYSLFQDQQITPTYLPDFARLIERIIERQEVGIFHVGTYPPTTPYEFGSYVATKTGRDMEVKQGSLVEYMQGKTPKPVYGGLDTQKTREKLNIEFHSWQEAIDEVLG